MTPAELATILEQHKQWLNNPDTGARADLYGAVLTGANLARADLTGAYLARATLAGADLTGANLTGANLYGADLYWATLTGANLNEADLAGANLTGAAGIRWGCIAPVGQGRRIVTAWAQDSLPEPVIAGDCFQGTFAEFRNKVTGPGLPWDWHKGTDAEVARWRAECLAAADLLELAVTP